MLRQEITSLAKPTLASDVRERLLRPSRTKERDARVLSQTTENPSVRKGQYRSSPSSGGGEGGSGNGKGTARRYYAVVDDGEDWPPELNDFNQKFSKTLEGIKRRHDSVVTTIGTGQLVERDFLQWLIRPLQRKVSSNTSGRDNACKSTPTSKISSIVSICPG